MPLRRRSGPTPGGSARRSPSSSSSGSSSYATFRAFEGTSYEWRAYLSPFYSPFFDVAWAKGWALALPHAGDAHPARARVVPLHLLLLPQGLLPRVRVGPARLARSASGAPHRYNGETKLLLFQNLHRYAMYVAVIFLVILWKDAILAIVGWKDGVHVGVGTLVMLANCVLLSRVHFRLPQLPAPHRRRREQLLHGDARRAAPPALEARHGPQRAAPAARVGEPLLGRADRRLHPHRSRPAPSPT